MNRGFDPFREMDRFFSEVTRPTNNASAMPMDLYRDGDMFTAHIDMPGVDPASIDVDVEDRTLTVRAERRAVAPSEGSQWLARERTNGTFARQLTLGHGLALDKVAADYQDGVLTLQIPVAEQAKPRKVQVTHAGSPRSVAIEGEVEQPASAGAEQEHGEGQQA